MLKDSSPFRRPNGFTLIEVMIVVAIIGILAAIAFPSYTQAIQRSRRAEAQAVLMEGAQFMQRFYAANNRYDTLVDGTTAVPFPASLQRAPKDSGTTKSYDIGFPTGQPERHKFTLQAVPVGSDPCGTLTLTHTGVKGVVTGATVKDCWK